MNCNNSHNTGTYTGNDGPASGNNVSGPSSDNAHTAGPGLPRDESSNTLASNESYHTRDYKEAKAAELVNFINLFEDNTKTYEQKTKLAIENFTRLTNEAITRDSQVCKLKNFGYINIKLY